MTNLIETATAAAKKALGHLIATAGWEPGQAHLTGSAGAVAVRASSLDEDLDALLHEIQRRRGRA
jgi:hypothetical protein